MRGPLGGMASRLVNAGLDGVLHFLCAADAGVALSQSNTDFIPCPLSLPLLYLLRSYDL